MRKSRVFMLATLTLFGMSGLLPRLTQSQHIEKVTCPICDMDVKAEKNSSIHGHQHIFACEMAGHMEELVKNSRKYLEAPKENDIASNDIYKDSHEMVCPVCGAAYNKLHYAIAWGPKGEQKIFACSSEHAQQIYERPELFIAAAATQKNGFCDVGAALKPHGYVMFDGFQTAFGRDALCAMLLFQPFVLSSQVKYAFAFIGVVLLAMSLEAVGKYREHVQRILYRQYGKTISQTAYVALETPSLHKDFSGKSSMDVCKNRIFRQIPFWCKAVLAGFYMIAITIAYFLMLIVMMYETLMFLAVIIGLGLGFAFFQDIEADKLSGNVDPCCST